MRRKRKYLNNIIREETGMEPDEVVQAVQKLDDLPDRELIIEVLKAIRDVIDDRWYITHGLKELSKELREVKKAINHLSGQVDSPADTLTEKSDPVDDAVSCIEQKFSCLGESIYMLIKDIDLEEK